MLKQTLLTVLAVGLLCSSATALAASSTVLPDVDITYLGSTDAPQRGDFVFVRALGTNNEATSVRTRVYFTVAYPDGADRTYSVLSADVPASSSFQIQKVKRIKFPIPFDAPAGTYTVTLYAAADIASGGAVYDTDSFTFTLDSAVDKGGIPTPDVDITYLGSTDNPQRGDYVFVRALGTNNEAFAVRTRVYFTVAYPNGTTRTYSVLSADAAANSSYQIQQIKRIRIPIPVDAPDGTYTVTLYAADDIANGGTIYDTDSFTFTLAPVAPCIAGCVDTAIAGEASLVSSPEAGPNPFRTQTTIRYELADAAPVTLSVFDAMGREVASLVSGTQEAGTHSATLQAGDLPAGVYVWRLVAGSEVSTGRVTLTR